MLEALGFQSMKEFERAAVPDHIRVDEASVSDASIPPLSESQLLLRAAELAGKNNVFKSYIEWGTILLSCLQLSFVMYVILHQSLCPLELTGPSVIGNGKSRLALTDIGGHV